MCDAGSFSVAAKAFLDNMLFIAVQSNVWLFLPVSINRCFSIILYRPKILVSLERKTFVCFFVAIKFLPHLISSDEGDQSVSRSESFSFRGEVFTFVSKSFCRWMKYYSIARVYGHCPLSDPLLTSWEKVIWWGLRCLRNVFLCPVSVPSIDTLRFFALWLLPYCAALVYTSSGGMKVRCTVNCQKRQWRWVATIFIYVFDFCLL